MGPSLVISDVSEMYNAIQPRKGEVQLDQRSETVLAERALKALLFKNSKIDLHESHTIGHWCHMGPKNLVI